MVLLEGGATIKVRPSGKASIHVGKGVPSKSFGSSLWPDHEAECEHPLWCMPPSHVCHRYAQKPVVSLWWHSSGTIYLFEDMVSHHWGLGKRSGLGWWPVSSSSGLGLQTPKCPAFYLDAEV